MPAKYIKMSTLLYFRLGTCSPEVFWFMTLDESRQLFAIAKACNSASTVVKTWLISFLCLFKKRKKLSKKIDLGKFLQARLFLLTTSSSSHIFLPPRKNHISKKDLLGSKPLWNQIGIFPPLYYHSSFTGFNCTEN